VKHLLTVVWGSRKADEEDIEDRTVEYEFKSAAEMKAFVRGANDCVTWDGFQITECTDAAIELGEYGD
jgi:hypothetical protein